MCKEIVSDIQNNFCTQHVLPMFCKKKSFWQRFTCTFKRTFKRSTKFAVQIYQRWMIFTQCTHTHVSVTRNQSLSSRNFWWVQIIESYHTYLQPELREKKSPSNLSLTNIFFLVLGVLKSKISKKSFEPLLRKLDFKLFHYKAM